MAASQVIDSQIRDLSICFREVPWAAMPPLKYAFQMNRPISSARLSSRISMV
jgi:hypothetical protein